MSHVPHGFMVMYVKIITRPKVQCTSESLPSPPGECFSKKTQAENFELETHVLRSATLQKIRKMATVNNDKFIQ